MLWESERKHKFLSLKIFYLNFQTLEWNLLGEYLFFLLPGTFSVTTWTICGSDFHDPSHFFLNQFSGISKIRLFKMRVNLSPPSQSFHWRQNTKLVYSLPLHLHQEHFDLCGFRQQEMGISDNYGSHTWMCQNESIVISVEVTHRLIPLLPR